MGMALTMVNSRVKGSRNQRKCIIQFENDGYEVAIVERTGKFLKEKDAFGLFDIACMNKNTTVWVQITTNRNHPHKKFMKFSEEHQQVDTAYEQWVWIDHKGWRIFEYKRGKKYECTKHHTIKLAK